MSDHKVLQEVMLYLKGRLVDAIRAIDAGFTANNIAMASPAPFVDIPRTGDPLIKLTMYLFHVEANEHLNNERPLRIGNMQHARPFFVNLHLLITPVSTVAGEDHVLLSRSIQVLNSFGVIREPFLRLNLEPSQGEARLRMLTYSWEDMTKLWGAISKPHRLSVAYEVAAVPIESARLPENGPPVQEAILDVQQIR